MIVIVMGMLLFYVVFLITADDFTYRNNIICRTLNNEKQFNITGY